MQEKHSNLFAAVALRSLGGMSKPTCALGSHSTLRYRQLTSIVPADRRLQKTMASNKVSAGGQKQDARKEAERHSTHTAKPTAHCGDATASLSSDVSCLN